MIRPPKPPIVHRLEQRRADRSSRTDLDLMFWAAVVVMVVLAIGIVAWGKP